MRVIVCGSRDTPRTQLCSVCAWLDHIDANFTLTTIVHGGATGIDYLASEWAFRKNIRIEMYPAHWKLHGKAAGPMRNQKMIESNPDMVIAFPGGRGTADMVQRTKNAKVPLLRIKLLTPPMGRVNPLDMEYTSFKDQA